MIEHAAPAVLIIQFFLYIVHLYLKCRAMKICVLGAGIVGATTAYRLLERFPNLQVDLIADVFSPDTTTDVSAGLWLPYIWGGTSDANLESVRKTIAS
jgi:glycine/D-amino acid oxidase-like deaminating enzyme